MKDKFSIFIEESVYLTTIKYYEKMIKTKSEFYNSLLKEENFEEFQKKTERIWGNIKHNFMKERMEELEKMIDVKNENGQPILNENAEYKEIYKLTKLSKFKDVELRFKKIIDEYYYTKLKIIRRGSIDKEKYLADSIYDYDKIEQTIPYYDKNGFVKSYHTPASYLSMLYNVNLTRTAWNRTMYDSELLGNNLVYLVAHTYACPKCIESQGKIYSTDGATGIVDGLKYEPKELAIERGVGHPNCRHVWVLYWDKEQLQKNKFNSEEWEEKYITKQKIRALQLKLQKIENNANIFEKLNSFEKMNKENKKILRITNEIEALNKSIGK